MAEQDRRKGSRETASPKMKRMGTVKYNRGSADTDSSASCSLSPKLNRSKTGALAMGRTRSSAGDSPFSPAGKGGGGAKGRKGNRERDRGSQEDGIWVSSKDTGDSDRSSGMPAFGRMRSMVMGRTGSIVAKRDSYEGGESKISASQLRGIFREVRLALMLQNSGSAEPRTLREIMMQVFQAVRKAVWKILMVQRFLNALKEAHQDGEDRRKQEEQEAVRRRMQEEKVDQWEALFGVLGEDSSSEEEEEGLAMGRTEGDMDPDVDDLEDLPDEQAHRSSLKRHSRRIASLRRAVDGAEAAGYALDTGEDDLEGYGMEDDEDLCDSPRVGGRLATVASIASRLCGSDGGSLEGSPEPDDEDELPSADRSKVRLPTKKLEFLRQARPRSQMTGSPSRTSRPMSAALSSALSEISSTAGWPQLPPPCRTPRPRFLESRLGLREEAPSRPPVWNPWGASPVPVIHSHNVEDIKEERANRKAGGITFPPFAVEVRPQFRFRKGVGFHTPFGGPSLRSKAKATSVVPSLTPVLSTERPPSAKPAPKRGAGRATKSERVCFYDWLTDPEEWLDADEEPVTGLGAWSSMFQSRSQAPSRAF